MSKKVEEKRVVKSGTTKAAEVMVPLRRIRQEKGMSRHQLSMATDISIRNIEVYEQGKVALENVSYRTVKTLADALGVEMEELVDG
jgi:transcriptional regulator with XRE-family HTH domain